MFKRLQKSVIDKNNLLLSYSIKRKINQTPRKIILPNRTNLTFSNIIVNMNSAPKLGNINSWNNYDNTEIYNNSFYIKSLNRNTRNIHKSIGETKDDHSKLLSKVINGILCLKSNDLLDYCINLIEIIIYIRDNNEKHNFVDISNEVNNDLLKILYQIYSRIFPENSPIYLLIKSDSKKEMKIFKKIHSIYLFYILSGLSFINDKSKEKNIVLFNFLKQFIEKERCHDIKCPICGYIKNYKKKP